MRDIICIMKTNRVNGGFGMRYDWIDGYLMAKRGVTRDLQPEWNWIRYHIGGKMFAAVLLDDDDKPYYINMKLDPLEGEFLRGQYEDIIPGYYSDKRCWNSVKADGAVPDALVRSLLDKSFGLVLSGLSKKAQREALCLSACGQDCSECPFMGNRCQGCNACDGKVFHAPKGAACPIFACARRHRLPSCAGCDALPCPIWRDTRDPSLSDEAFERSIRDRSALLRAAWHTSPSGER